MTGTIRRYMPQDEQDWVRCRVLAFLDSSYYDDVLTAKDHYNNPSIELVSVRQSSVVGLLDIELEPEPGKVCSRAATRSGMIWHLAVHPDHRRKGIASALLAEAKREASSRGIERLEVWTRDGGAALAWYLAQGFTEFQRYLHVWLPGNMIQIEGLPGVRPRLCMGEYTGTNLEGVQAHAIRCHTCHGLELALLP